MMHGNERLTFYNKAQHVSDIKNNISIHDQITGPYFFLKQKIMWLKNFHKAYQNYYTIIRHVAKRKFPVEAILRNGNRIMLKNNNEAALFGLLPNFKEIEYDINGDAATIPVQSIDGEKKKIVLCGITKNTDAILVFKKGVYDDLPVKGKTVIDIGSNIGDTPIYFALNGANRVIGLEPFPKNFEIAKRNVMLNDLSEKITILLAGLAKSSGHITINPDYESDQRSRMQEFEHGVKIPLLSLEQILDENKVSEAVLKMDCEGCEYETVLSTHTQVLRRFSHIEIEFHHGYKNLREKLEKSGFRVSVSIQETMYEKGKIQAMMGNITAIRK